MGVQPGDQGWLPGGGGTEAESYKVTADGEACGCERACVSKAGVPIPWRMVAEQREADGASNTTRLQGLEGPTKKDRSIMEICVCPLAVS